MSATQKLLRFGVFELNLDTEEMRKSETVIKLPPQSFKLLVLLASHAGQGVSRDQIQKQLWDEETFVDFEHGVNKCIKQIRTVLGDNADQPLYVETLPRHGYRFIAPVLSKSIPAPRPKIVESDSGELSHAPVLLASTARASAAVARTLAVSHPATAPNHAGEAAPEPEVVGTGEPRLSVWRVRLLWIVAAVVLLALIGGGLYWGMHKPLEHFTNDEWGVAGSKPEVYEVGTDKEVLYNGRPSACIRSKENDIEGFGTLMQSFYADKYRGKRVRFSAFARSEKVPRWAGLWMRVDKGAQQLTFDNMRDRPIKGTTGWQKYEVVLDVPQDATDISFGILLAGSGKVWLNSVKFEAVGPDVPTTPLSHQSDEPRTGFDN